MKCFNYIIHTSTSAPNMYHHLYQASTSTMHQYHDKMNYNQYVSSCMYSISTIHHVPIILLVGASNHVPTMYQSCINYRSSYNSSMMYNMTTSSTHQLHVPLCSPSSCQIHAPRYKTNMHLTIHINIYQWNSNMYQPCIPIDHPQPPLTTVNTKHPIIHVLEVCLNKSMTSLASIIMIYLIIKVP
jgi:hypothetical protein